MNHNITRLFAIAFLLCALPFISYAQSDNIIKEITNRATPLATENIEILAPLAGKWNYTATVGDKDGASTGTITNELIMDDRFLSSYEIGSLYIEGNELPFKKQQFIGYDNAKKSFSFASISTLSTGMMVGQGMFNKKENTFNATGNFTNPLTGAQEKFREVIELTNPEHYKRTIFTTGKSGKETKLMEFFYSRDM